MAVFGTRIETSKASIPATERARICCLVLLTLLATPVAVLAQPAKYPTRLVTLVVPFAPGGGTDTTARILGQKLSERWGKPVVIENRPGASGNLGLEYVSKARPDGHTIMMGNIGTQAINPSLYTSMPFDPEKAFAPITLVNELPLVFLVNPALPVKNVAEFVSYGKANPANLTYGTSGAGSSIHLAAELFSIAADVKMVHVPYRGGGPALQDLLGGHIKLSFPTVLESSGYIANGTLRALAVTSLARSPALPDVPTIAELGYPGFNSISWVGLLAPAGTPQEIIDTIASDTKWVLENTDASERMIKQGAIPKGTSPAEFSKIIADDRARYGKVIKEKNITAQ